MSEKNKNVEQNLRDLCALVTFTSIELHAMLSRKVTSEEVKEIQRQESERFRALEDGIKAIKEQRAGLALSESEEEEPEARAADDDPADWS